MSSLEIEKKLSHSKCSLFIRGIPIATTNDELLKLFSEIGPIRSCFVVNSRKDAESSSSKFIYGFVRFVTTEDAEKALHQLQHTKFKGSKLKIEVALKKNILTETPLKRNEETVFNLEPSKIAILPISDSPDIVGVSHTKSPNILKSSHSKLYTKLKKNPKNDSTSLFIMGLPDAITKKQLYKKLKKFGCISSLVFPFNGNQSSCLTTYSTEKEASIAQTRIHDHVFKGVKLSATLSAEIKQKSHRLIVRNLSFSITEEDLKILFCPFGEIIEIQIPKKSDGSAIGFAFVQLRHKVNADKALNELNAKLVKGRKIAVDYSISKSAYLTYKGEKIIKDNVLNSAAQIDSADYLEANLNDLISENTKEINHSKDEEELNDLSFDNDKANEGKKENSSENENDHFVEDVRGSLSSMENSYHSVEQANDSTNLILNNHLHNNEDFGKTLFIRNLLFETEGETILEKFSKFGQIHYVKLVKDRFGRSKGCAFISFKDNKDAESCIQMFDSSPKPPSFIQNSLDLKKVKTSKLSLDLYENLNTDWIIDGRHIDVLRAIPKISAKEISDKTNEEKKVNDKRNLYLLKESFIDLSSPEGKELSTMDRQKRIKAAQERTVKLKNLNCFISTTRVSIRNMPSSVDDQQLKDIIYQSLSKAYPEFKPSSKFIRQIKIMKSEDRKLPTGKLKNLGYAFVEFSDHKYALSLVRKMNNKKDIFTADKRPIVEFAIENSAIIAKRQERNQSKYLNNNPLKRTLPEKAPSPKLKDTDYNGNRNPKRKKFQIN